jgi:hypothetical protein
MGGNSFQTHDGAHVGGAVAMALDDKGNAVPIEADTPIGTVKIEGLSFTLEQFCRALGAHASIVAKTDAEAAAKTILAFARKDKP